MAATIIIILTVPLFFKFEHWTDSEEKKPKPLDLLQIDATVIAGILIFLTINASTTQNAGQNEHQNATQSLPARALIAALTTLTIIPFALSSIIVLIWGNNMLSSAETKSRKCNAIAS
jgi:hypothetical protein